MRVVASVLLAVLCAANASHHQMHNHVNRVLRKLNSIVPEPIPNASTHFYNNAVLDHFLDSVASPEAPKWSQRYFVDQTHRCGAGCPVFLLIGGEDSQGDARLSCPSRYDTVASQVLLHLGSS